MIGYPLDRVAAWVTGGYPLYFLNFELCECVTYLKKKKKVKELPRVLAEKKWQQAILFQVLGSSGDSV